MGASRWALLAAALFGASGPLIFAQLLFAPSSAAAQDDDTTPPEAVEFYRLAREHYEAGAYEDAADDLERALMLDPDSPTLVYNLARVYELLGQPDQALRRYEQYQQLLPQQQAREQARAEATIRRLQGAASQTQAEEPPRPDEVVALRQLPGLVLVRERGVADAAFWGVLIGGGLVLASGAVLAGVALEQRNRVDEWIHGDGMGPSEQEAVHDTARFLGLGADVAFGVGGVAVVAAGMLYFLREHTVERAPIDAVDEGDDEEQGASVRPTIDGGAGFASVGITGCW